MAELIRGGAGEIETKEERKKRDVRGERRSSFLLLFNFVVYIILISCI